MIRAVVIAGVVLVTSWALLAAIAARLPPGLLKESLGFLPNCVTFVRRLRRDPRVPREALIEAWPADPAVLGRLLRARASDPIQGQVGEIE